MKISYPDLCPICLAGGVSNSFVMDMDVTPLVYVCLAGHTFDELPTEAAVPVAEALPPPDQAQAGDVRPFDEIVQELEKDAVPVKIEENGSLRPIAEFPGFTSEPEPVSIGASAAAELAETPPAVPVRFRAMIEPPPPVALVEKPAAVDVAVKIRAAMAKKAAPLCPEDVLTEVLRLGVVDIGGGEKLVVLRVPERVVIDVAAMAGEHDFRVYFNALMVEAFNFGWFQNLNVQL